MLIVQWLVHFSTKEKFSVRIRICNSVPCFMVPSTRGLSHQPFKLESLGSNPAGITTVILFSFYLSCACRGFKGRAVRLIIIDKTPLLDWKDALKCHLPVVSVGNANDTLKNMALSSNWTRTRVSQARNVGSFPARVTSQL